MKKNASVLVNLNKGKKFMNNSLSISEMLMIRGGSKTSPEIPDPIK
jgi:hypothetical protein